MMPIVDPHIYLGTARLGTARPGTSRVGIAHPGTARPGTTHRESTQPETVEQTYDLADYLAESSQFHVLRAVHVQSEVPALQALKETRLLQTLANTPGSGGLPNAIVAYCELSDPDASDYLDRLTQYENLRGIRYRFQSDNSCLDQAALLQHHNLSCDLDLDLEQMAGIVTLANRYPDISIVLNLHAYLGDQSGHNASRWHAALNQASGCDNISIKVAGLRMANPLATDYGQVLVDDIIKHLGTDRLMFASHFPSDRQHSSFDELWRWYCDITCKASARDRDKLFRSNAIRIYRL